MFVVIVKRVEEEAQAHPLIGGTIDLAIIVSMLGGVPERQTIGSQAASSCDTKLDFYLPPVKVGLRLGPNGSLLAAQRRCYSNLIGASDGIWKKVIPNDY